MDRWKKQPPLLKIWDITFIAWLAVLVVLVFVASPNVGFLDVMTNNVATVYQAEVPLARYLLEPVSGLVFLVLRAPVEAVFIVASIYVAGRVIVTVLNKRRYHGQLNRHPLIESLARALIYLFKATFTIIPLAAALIVLFTWPTQGFLGLANNFAVWLVAGFWVLAMMFVMKLLSSWVKILYPNFHLPITWTRARKDRKKRFDGSKWTGARHMAWKGLREGRFLLAFIMSVAFVEMCFVSLPLPTQYIRADLAPGEMIMDFHVHTTASDGFMSAGARVLWYISQGVTAAAFSDHHHPLGSFQAQAFVDRFCLNFTVITAQEFTDDGEDIHLNVFGINEDLTPVNYTYPPGPNAMNVTDMIKWVKLNGGFVTVNHYGSNASAPFTYEFLRDAGVDGFEVVNGGDLSSEILTFCRANNLACISGSDEPLNPELDCFTRLKLEDPANRSLAAIFATLKKNTHEVVIINCNLGEDSEVILNYFLRLDTYQVLSWMAWSVGVYLVGLGFYRKARKLSLPRDFVP